MTDRARFHLLASFLIVSFALLLALVCNAQVVSNQVSPEDEDAVRAIAAVLAPVPNRASAILKSINFTPIARSIPHFEEWPALRQIETGYISAEAAGGPSEGQNFLRVMSLVVAEDYTEAIRSEDSLKTYFAGTSPDTAVNRNSVRFAQVPQQTAKPASPQVRAAIDVISVHVDNIPGGIQSTIANCCGQKPAEIYDILRSSDSRAAALARAVQEGKIPPVEKARLLRLIKLVAENIHAVSYTPELKPYLDALDIQPGEPSGLAQTQYASSATIPAWTTDDDNAVAQIVRDSAIKAGLPQTEASKLAVLVNPVSSGQQIGSEKPKVVKLVDHDRQSLLASNGGNSPTGGLGGGLGSGENPSDHSGSPPPAAASGGSPSTGPGGGGPSPSSDPSGENITRYHEVEMSVTEGGGGPSPRVSPSGAFGGPEIPFETLRISSEGFGGVVFGAPITVSRIARPSHLYWVAEDHDASGKLGWGHFDIVLTNGSTVMTRRMQSDGAYAAWEIISGRPPVFQALDIAHDEGVGLASVPHDDDSDEGLMVVHPALYGLEIGDAAVMADAIGFMMDTDAFKQHIEATGAAQAIVNKAVNWRTTNHGFYKIIDAPLQIELRDGLLRVERVQSDGYPQGLRQVGFLDFQALSQTGRPLPERGTDFYEILPTLTTAFAAFDRLNAFAETFAILRWAKLSGATIKPPVPQRLGDARLHIFNLPNGDLAQSAWSVDKAEAAFQLSDLQRLTETTRAAMRAAGAPGDVLQRVSEIAAAKQAEIRLSIAESELQSVPDEVLSNDSETDAVGAKIEEQQKEVEAFLDRFSTEDTIVISLASAADSAKLRELQNNINIASNAKEEADEALDTLNDPKTRIEALPSERQTKALQLYEKSLDAKLKFELTDNGAKKKAAEAKSQALDRQLQRMLPPIPGAKENAAQALVEEKNADLEKAQSEFKEAERAQMPPWLKSSWPAIQKLAIGSEPFDAQ